MLNRRLGPGDSIFLFLVIRSIKLYLALFFQTPSLAPVQPSQCQEKPDPSLSAPSQRPCRSGEGPVKLDEVSYSFPFQV